MRRQHWVTCGKLAGAVRSRVAAMAPGVHCRCKVLYDWAMIGVAGALVAAGVPSGDMAGSAAVVGLGQRLQGGVVPVCACVCVYVSRGWGIGRAGVRVGRIRSGWQRFNYRQPDCTTENRDVIFGGYKWPPKIAFAAETFHDSCSECRTSPTPHTLPSELSGSIYTLLKSWGYL
ncbi:hypothetical protein BS78_09G086700 [Paspalum vaginatum]|nr:hypothetical protein BS78_09G086700 [Paspalum vaginatum]